GGHFGGDVSRPGARNIGVCVAPGATTFAVIPRGASSAAQLLIIPTIAALVATYCDRPAAPWDVLLPIATNLPPGSMPGAKWLNRVSHAWTCNRQSIVPVSLSRCPSGAAAIIPA